MEWKECPVVLFVETEILFLVTILCDVQIPETVSRRHRLGKSSDYSVLSYIDPDFFHRRAECRPVSFRLSVCGQHQRRQHDRSRQRESKQRGTKTAGAKSARQC